VQRANRVLVGVSLSASVLHKKGECIKSAVMSLGPWYLLVTWQLASIGAPWIWNAPDSPTPCPLIYPSTFHLYQNDEDLKLTQVCNIENPRLKKFRLWFSGSSLQKQTSDLFENLLHWMQVIISCDWSHRKRFSELFRANPHPLLQACPATTRGLCTSVDLTIFGGIDGQPQPPGFHRLHLFWWCRCGELRMVCKTV